MQQVVDLVGLDAAHRLAPVNQPLANHLHRNPNGRLRGALAGASLEQIELVSLDRELHVLQVPEVALPTGSRVVPALRFLE